MTPAEEVERLAVEAFRAFSQFMGAPWYRRLWWVVGGSPISPRYRAALEAWYVVNTRITPDARGKPGAPWKKRT